MHAIVLALPFALAVSAQEPPTLAVSLGSVHRVQRVPRTSSSHVEQGAAGSPHPFIPLAVGLVMGFAIGWFASTALNERDEDER